MSLKSFQQIFDDDRMVVIPMIQRDYAQGRKNEHKVRKGIVDKLNDIINGKPGNLDFIYGSLEGNSFIPLDGQQRLTTLFLLYWLAAKREEGIAEDEYAFLRRFSYQTRANSRYFCQHLVEFTPGKDKEIANDIRDQKWYRLEWNDDPTVDSMLRMLSYLDKYFYPDKQDIAPIWDKLNRIKFYVFHLTDLGLTDDIYIKMNSRGKPLTDFEHFKASFDRVSSMKMASKMDQAYTDRMWRLGMESNKTKHLRESDNEFIPDVDTYLLNFIHVISRLITLATKGTEPSPNPMDWINDIYSKPSRVAMLERAFDCMADKSADGVFDSFLEKSDSDPAKVNIDRTEVQLFDLACIDGASSMGYTELLLFYAFLLYLNNNRTYPANSTRYIKREDMLRRVRILRNLLKKSNNELRPDRISEIFREVGTLILKGTLDSGRKALNDNQRNEEIAKQQYLSTHPAEEAAIAAIENHTLLLGSLSALGWEKPELFDSFRDVFKNYSKDSSLLTRAMLTIGDIACKENSWRNRIGVGISGLDSLWRETFFVTRDNNKISGVLPRFLEAYSEALNSGKSHYTILNDMIASYNPAHFGHISYIIKYPVVLEKARYGKFFVDSSKWSMGWIALYTQLQPGRNWSIIHLAIKKEWQPQNGQKQLQLDEYNDFLQIKDTNHYLDCTKHDAVYMYQLDENNEYIKLQQEYPLPEYGTVDVVEYIITNVLPLL